LEAQRAEDAINNLFRRTALGGKYRNNLFRRTGRGGKDRNTHLARRAGIEVANERHRGLRARRDEDGGVGAHHRGELEGAGAEGEVVGHDETVDFFDERLLHLLVLELAACERGRRGGGERERRGGRR
jgi:hypothetical protein